MVNPGSNSIREPSTPPIVVEEKQNTPGAYDAQSLSEAEWERSSETFHVKSTTPSMVNYAEFSTSVDVTPTAAGTVTEGAGGAEAGAGDSVKTKLDFQTEGEENSSEQGQPSPVKNEDDEATDDVSSGVLEGSLEKSTTVIA